MNALVFTLLFGGSVIVSTLVWLYLVGITLREFGGSLT